jgi:hypothetical protein
MPTQDVPPTAEADPLAWLGIDSEPVDVVLEDAPSESARPSKDLTDPTLPELRTQAQSEAMVNPAMRLAALRGAWVQTGSDFGADYSFGGYACRVLLLRDSDATLQVVSGFGRDLATRMSETLTFELTTDGLIKISRPAGADPNLALLPTGASRPSQGTATLRLKTEGDRLQLGDKTYDRMDPSAARRFLAGGPLLRQPPPGATPTKDPIVPATGSHLAILLLPSPQSSSRVWQAACAALRDELMRLPPSRQVCILGAGNPPPIRWIGASSPAAASTIALSESASGRSGGATQFHQSVKGLAPPPDAILVVTDQSSEIREVADMLDGLSQGIPRHIVCVRSEDIDRWARAVPSANVRGIPGSE